MIKIERINENEHVPLYFNETLVGYIENQLEYLKARGDIKDENIYGYYIIFNNEKIKIDKNGNLEKEPANLFPKFLDYLVRLV